MGDAERGALRPLTRWPGKPAYGLLALAGGVMLRVGGKRATSAGKFGMRDSAIDAVTIAGPAGTRTLTLAVARAEPTLTPLRDGRVVVSGGFTISMDFSWEDVIEGDAAVKVVDPLRGMIQPAGELKVARYHHGAIEVAPGKLLVVGGSSRDGEPIGAVETIKV